MRRFGSSRRKLSEELWVHGKGVDDFMDIQGSEPNKRKTEPMNSRPIAIWLLVGLTLFMLLLAQSVENKRVESISYSALRKAILDGRVKTLIIQKETGTIRGEYQTTGLSDDAPKQFTSKGADAETIANHLVPLLEKRAANPKLPPIEWDWEEVPFWRKAVGYVLPIVILGLFFYLLIYRQLKAGGGGGILSFGKSRAVRITKDKSQTTFDDVAGIDEAREEVREIIEFLRNPEKFQRLGGRLPRGVLLVGSPGTGKTLLAKAIAGEADVPFFSISGSDFVEMFVGVGASRVRDLFEQAKANSPCIVFLDEVDAVGRRRMNDIPGSGQESAQTLNAILVEMDGFTSDDKVIVIAATNRPDVLDPALLRPGRFDRQIYVDMPDIKGREAILRVHVKRVKLAEDVDLSVLARMTPNFSGAELANMVNEAALIAAMRGKDAVDMECFEEARDKVRWGKEKRSRALGEEDRRATAFHEAGHALLMRLLPHVTPLHKVTIIPRGRALGATMQLPEKDEYNMSKRRLLGEITVRLGGRAAEEIFLEDITNGAANDLEQATLLVRSMICEWGMSDRLGLTYFGEPRSIWEGLPEVREYSEATAEKIDEEVRRILDHAYREALHLLREHADDVRLLVDALLEFESLGREEVDLLLSSRSLDVLRKGRDSGSRSSSSASASPEQKSDSTKESQSAQESPTEDLSVIPEKM